MTDSRGSAAAQPRDQGAEQPQCDEHRDERNQHIVFGIHGIVLGIHGVQLRFEPGILRVKAILKPVNLDLAEAIFLMDWMV